MSKEKESNFALLVVLFILLIVVGSGFHRRYCVPVIHPSGGFYGYEGETNAQYNNNPQYLNPEFNNNIRNPLFNNMPE